MARVPVHQHAAEIKNNIFHIFIITFTKNAGEKTFSPAHTKQEYNYKTSVSSISAPVDTSANFGCGYTWRESSRMLSKNSLACGVKSS